MVNNSLWRGTPLPIDSVVEVRLCGDMWEKVVGVARGEKRSYSHVVRYALFRFIRRGSVNRFAGLRHDPRSGGVRWRYQELHERARGRRFGAATPGCKHRHRLCLYGEDELFLRIAAARLRCTMTHLVRLALERYLDELCAKAAWKGTRRVFWYWLGLRHYEDVEFPIYSPEIQLLRFKKYPKSSYF